jgi:hypothetical protein
LCELAGIPITLGVFCARPVIVSPIGKAIQDIGPIANTVFKRISTGKQGARADALSLLDLRTQIVLRIRHHGMIGPLSTLETLYLPMDPVRKYGIAFDCLVFPSYLSEQEDVGRLITG